MHRKTASNLAIQLENVARRFRFVALASCVPNESDYTAVGLMIA